MCTPRPTQNARNHHAKRADRLAWLAGADGTLATPGKRNPRRSGRSVMPPNTPHERRLRLAAWVCAWGIVVAR